MLLKSTLVVVAGAVIDDDEEWAELRTSLLSLLPVRREQKTWAAKNSVFKVVVDGRWRQLASNTQQT